MKQYLRICQRQLLIKLFNISEYGVVTEVLQNENGNMSMKSSGNGMTWTIKPATVFFNS
ncbi:MAG: hypothetical protein ACXVLT_00100 [Flavisolibacter sp.]